MKFTCSVDIKLPKARTVELWSDPENLVKWQDGFKSFEHLSGNPGEVGAKSEMKYENGSHKIELLETIISNNLPDEFTGRYEAKQMVNTMKNTFTEISENETRWEAEIEYLSFHGFMPKLMAFLMPGMFRKQTQKWLDQFRDFCEKEG